MVSVPSFGIGGKRREGEKVEIEEEKKHFLHQEIDWNMVVCNVIPRKKYLV